MTIVSARIAIEVHYRTNERGVSVASHHNGYDVTPGHDMSVEQTDALREFFRRETDDALGRWRSASDPAWTAVLDADTGYVKVRNDDGHRSFSFIPGSPATLTPWVKELREIAKEYIESHPEQRPWQGAKPGEVWALGIGGGYHCDSISVIETQEGIRFIWGVKGGEIRNIAITDRTIDYGKRVFPPEDAS